MGERSRHKRSIELMSEEGEKNEKYMRIERAGEHKAQNVSQIHSVNSHRMFSCTRYLHRWINGGQHELDNLWYKK